MSKARRWPLCIDPQSQANRYIKSMGKDLAENGMEAVKLTDELLRSLENGVRFGRWVLLENIFESLDAALEPILQRNVFKQGGQDMMRIGTITFLITMLFDSTLQRNYLTPIMRLRHA